jgi:hypothetical protein
MRERRKIKKVQKEKDSTEFFLNENFIFFRDTFFLFFEKVDTTKFFSNNFFGKQNKEKKKIKFANFPRYLLYFI